MSKTTILIVTFVTFLIGFTLPFFILDLLNLGASDDVSGATLNGAIKSTASLVLAGIIGVVTGFISAFAVRHLLTRTKK